MKKVQKNDSREKPPIFPPRDHYIWWDSNKHTFTSVVINIVIDDHRAIPWKYTYFIFIYTLCIYESLF